MDLSADFRVPRELYERWYGPHPAPKLLDEAVYGLTELNREQIRDAELVAAPGCYPTAALLALLPLKDIAERHVRSTRSRACPARAARRRRRRTSSRSPRT